MQAYIFAASCFAFILAASAVPVEEKNIPHNDLFSETHTCIPLMKFIEVCNTCVCNDDGKAAICTRMSCPVPEKPKIDGFKDGFACVPGKTFYDGCKSCKCSESGNSAECDLVKDCDVDASAEKPVEQDAPVVLPNYPHIDNYAETGKCNPGKSFYHECNTCHCSLDGKTAGCTLMMCPEYQGVRIDNYVQGEKCPAGKSFDDKCNSCRCSADGLSAACTLIECPDVDFD